MGRQPEQRPAVWSTSQQIDAILKRRTGKSGYQLREEWKAQGEKGGSSYINTILKEELGKTRSQLYDERLIREKGKSQFQIRDEKSIRETGKTRSQLRNDAKRRNMSFRQVYEEARERFQAAQAQAWEETPFTFAEEFSGMPGFTAAEPDTSAEDQPGADPWGLDLQGSRFE